MNQNGFTLPQVVALVFIILVAIVVILIVKNFIPEEEAVYVEYEEIDKPEITLNGSYTEYVQMNEEYEEKGVVATTQNGKNVSNYVVKTIYEGNHVVTSLDTSKFNTYKINYTVTDPDNKSLTTTVSRVVIVTDSTSPKISFPETKTITGAEALSYDLEEGVIVTDNSGEVTFTYDNTLMPVSGDYVITYKATDSSGNKTTRKRLIKVTDSIEIKEENNKLVIDYPSSPNDKTYTYKYSLDNGYTWMETDKYTKIDLTDVIAAVYENDNYIMSLSYKQ